MASTECCICGKKIGRFDKSIALSPNAPDLMLCNDCNNEIKLVGMSPISKDNPMARHQQKQAMHHIAEAINNNALDEVTADVILNELADELVANEIRSLSSSKKESAEKAAEAERRYLEERGNILMTTGYQFNGYEITEYHGVFSGDSVIGTGLATDIKASFSDFAGVESGSLVSKIKDAKSSAMRDLVKQAMLAGGNAIIAIQYDIYPYGSMLGVNITGTSVTIEKCS